MRQSTSIIGCVRSWVGRLVYWSGNAFVRRSTRRTLLAYLALLLDVQIDGMTDSWKKNQVTATGELTVSSTDRQHKAWMKELFARNWNDQSLTEMQNLYPTTAIIKFSWFLCVTSGEDFKCRDNNQRCCRFCYYGTSITASNGSRWTQFYGRYVSMRKISTAFIKKNKARYTATEVACGWAGAIFEATRLFGQKQ